MDLASRLETVEAVLKAEITARLAAEARAKEELSRSLEATSRLNTGSTLVAALEARLAVAECQAAAAEAECAALRARLLALGGALPPGSARKRRRDADERVALEAGEEEAELDAGGSRFRA